jgi:hypothetical protein
MTSRCSALTLVSIAHVVIERSVDSRSVATDGHWEGGEMGSRLARTIVALGVGASALLWAAAPGGAQDAVPVPKCGTAGPDGVMLRANLTIPDTVTMKLGRESGDVLETQVNLTWSDACSLTTADLASIKLAPGALTGDARSIPTKAITIVPGDVADNTATIVLGVKRRSVNPGHYSGTLIIRTDTNNAVARAEIPVEVLRQEKLFGPNLFYSPFVVLVVALLGGLVFGWYRGKAIAGADTNPNQRALGAWDYRNIIAFALAAGAGIGAWTANYVSTPDFQLDLKTCFSLFAVIATPTATAMLAIGKPSTADPLPPAVVT